jgi:hypothetical protein
VKRALALPFAVALVLGQREAQAQVRWDAELQEGAEKRILTSKPSGGSDSRFSPSLEASGHVALIPLVRVGLYARYEASSIARQDTRQMLSGGLDVRVLFPWPQGDTRLYARIGLGKMGTYAPSHPAPDRPDSVMLAGAWGHFTEVPLAIGLVYRVSSPVWLTAEAGARVGFAFAGNAYGVAGESGDDTVALFLSAGLMWGR